MAEKVFITGNPGTGKSSLVLEIVHELGLKAGGISTPEIRRGGVREGFKIRNLKTGQEGILASTDIKTKPRVGKYGINLKELNEVGVQAIKNALNDPDIELVVIDELGAMEMCSDQFAQAVETALESPKILLVILHRRLAPNYRERGKIFTLTRDNKESVKKRVMEILK